MLLNLAFIVLKLNLPLVTKNNLRRIIAVSFLVFLLAEWGSHGVIYANSTSVDEQAVSADEGGHQDPCATLICSDGQRRNRQTPSLGHDATQHNAFFDQLSDLPRLIRPQKDPGLPSRAVNRLFRPIIPPFHPPELS